jgi:hypothetical protein
LRVEELPLQIEESWMRLVINTQLLLDVLRDIPPPLPSPLLPSRNITSGGDDQGGGGEEEQQVSTVQ